MKNEKLIKDEREVSNITNFFFVNIAPNLDIKIEHDF